jgi:mannose-6-phosphate isomerase-like protein (cupin superfamily)
LGPPNERDVKMIIDPATTGHTGFSILVSILPPGGSTGVHVHDGSDEIVHFGGRGRGVIRGAAEDAEAGAVLLVPAGTEHECRNTSAVESLRLFCAFVPALDVKQGVLADLAELTRRVLTGAKGT